VYSILHLELCTRILHSERCVMDHSFSAAFESSIQSCVLDPLFRTMHSNFSFKAKYSVLSSEHCACSFIRSLYFILRRVLKSFILSEVIHHSYGTWFSMFHMERGSQTFIWSGVLNPSYGAGFSILHLERGSQSFIWSGVLNPSF